MSGKVYDVQGGCGCLNDEGNEEYKTFPSYQGEVFQFRSSHPAETSLIPPYRRNAIMMDDESVSIDVVVEYLMGQVSSGVIVPA